MSRSWRNQLSQSWFGNGLRRYLGRIHTLHLKGNAAEVLPSHEGAPTWQAAMLALQQQIEAERLSGRVKVVVSNAFVRYVLMPWTDQRLTPAERVELARTLFAERYGEQGEWHIALEAERFEAPTLAAAIDTGLREALQALCNAKGLALASLTPALIERLDAQRGMLRQVRNGWFVDGSDDRLAALAFCAGEWSQVSNEPGADLLPLLRRDAIRVPDLIDGKVFAAGVTGNLDVITQSWSLVRLDLPSPLAPLPLMRERGKVQGA